MITETISIKGFQKLYFNRRAVEKKQMLLSLIPQTKRWQMNYSEKLYPRNDVQTSHYTHPSSKKRK